jgi:hypothetical protein
MSDQPQPKHDEETKFLLFRFPAEGSLAGLDTQLLPGGELSVAERADGQPALQEIDELQKMLLALRRKLSLDSPLGTCRSPRSPGSH